MKSLTLGHFTTTSPTFFRSPSNDNKLIEKLVAEHLTDKRWREVFLLVAGIKNNADQLLELMEIATIKLINGSKLRDLLKWVETVTDPNDTYFKYLGKRSLCIGNAIVNANAKANGIEKLIAYTNAISYANTNAIGHANIIDNAITYVNANTNAISHAITITIKKLVEYTNWLKKWPIYQGIDYAKLIDQLEKFKTQIPDNKESIEIKKAFIDNLFKIWFAAFNTTRETIILSKEEIKTLDQYLYANLLMIQCKDAAVRVSNKTWSKIESRMLLPINL